MSRLVLKCSLLSLAALFAAATVDVANAGNNKRKARGGSSDIMRLGGPTNGAAATRVDRSGGPSLRTNAEIERFFNEQRERGGRN